MKICPITGEPCENNKPYHVSEIIDGETKRQIMMCNKCVLPFLYDKITNDNQQEILNKLIDVSNNKEDNVDKLKKELSKCLQKEKYEKAAILRDAIQKLNQ